MDDIKDIVAQPDDSGAIESIKAEAGDVVVEWTFPEYIQYQRGLWWYVIALVAVAALLVFSFFTDNQLFMIMIVLSVVIFIIANSRHPEQVYFALTEDGFVLKDRFFHYEDMKNFWIIYQPPHVKTLYFEPSSVFAPRIQIHLENQNPAQIREFLLQHLNEDLAKEEEPSSEVWGRLFKL